MKHVDFKAKGADLNVNGHTVEIPFDPVFANKENIVFSAMYTEPVSSQSELYKNWADKDRFLSGQFSVEARQSSNAIQSSENSLVRKIDVRNMAFPIRISLPNAEPGETSICAFFNENFNLWQPI